MNISRSDLYFLLLLGIFVYLYQTTQSLSPVLTFIVFTSIIVVFCSNYGCCCKPNVNKILSVATANSSILVQPMNHHHHHPTPHLATNPYLIGQQTPCLWTIPSGLNNGNSAVYPQFVNLARLPPQYSGNLSGNTGSSQAMNPLTQPPPPFEYHQEAKSCDILQGALYPQTQHYPQQMAMNPYDSNQTTLGVVLPNLYKN